MELILIIVIICLVVKNSSYRDEITELEVQVKNLKEKLMHYKLEERTKYSNIEINDVTDSLKKEEIGNIYETIDTFKYSENITDYNSIEYTTQNNSISNDFKSTDFDSESIKKSQKSSKPYAKQDARNTAILSVGAMFIVIAAISFLFTNWEVLTNFIKSGILLILAAMFFGMSNIAKKVFKLPQTAKTFYYIALGYIPIVLYSFAILGMIGDYYSLNGDGFPIYITFSTVIVTIIYLLLSFKNKDKHLYYASNVMQGMSVIFFTAIFTDDFKIIFLVLFIYSTIYNYLCGRVSNPFINSICKYLNYFLCIECVIGFFVFVEAISEIIGILTALFIMLNCIRLYNQKILHGFFPLISSFLFLLSCVCFKIICEVDYTVEVIWELPYLAKQICVFLYVLVSSFYCNFVTNKKDLAPTANFLNTIYMTFLVFSARDKIALEYVFIMANFLMVELLYYKSGKKEKFTLIYSLIMSYIALFAEQGIMQFIILFIISALGVISTDNDKEKYVKLIPLTGFLIGMYTSDLALFDNLYFMAIATWIIIIWFTCFNMKRKDFAYVSASFAYLIALILGFANHINEYVISLMIFVCGILQLICTENLEKDFVKGILCTNFLWIYMMLVNDLGLEDVTFVTIGGFLLYAYFVIRGILKKYIPTSYKNLEYIVCTISYLIAFAMYSSILDATLFIAMLVVIIVLSYLKRVGPAFLCSLIALVINMFYITRAFWLRVPWWVYLVVVGGTLITFAIRNEIAEKKNNLKSLKDKMEKVKNYLDM